MLASTLTTIVVFFPGDAALRRQQVSVLRAGAGGGALAAGLVRGRDDVVPLFCARFINARSCTQRMPERTIAAADFCIERFNAWFNPKFEALPGFLRPRDQHRSASARSPFCLLLTGIIVLSLFLFPLLDFSFFPRTDPGQFMMNIKLPSGTRIGLTEEEIAKVEDLVRHEV